jgi:hypothetical protein
MTTIRWLITSRTADLPQVKRLVVRLVWIPGISHLRIGFCIERSYPKVCREWLGGHWEFPP